MHFPKEETKRGWEEDGEWERETERERKDWEMKVAAWHRECDSVMQAGFIVSPQRPGEIISSQYGVYQSSQNTTLPSWYMSRLSASLSVYLSVCLHAAHRFIQHQENIVSRKWVACYIALGHLSLKKMVAFFFFFYRQSSYYPLWKNNSYTLCMPVSVLSFFLLWVELRFRSL